MEYTIVKNVDALLALANPLRWYAIETPRRSHVGLYPNSELNHNLSQWVGA